MMKQINENQEITVQRTHTIFMESNIVGQTERAYKIRILNQKGAWKSIWVPKSRICFIVLPNSRKRFYIPKFFTKAI